MNMMTLGMIPYHVMTLLKNFGDKKFLLRDVSAAQKTRNRRKEILRNPSRNE